MLLYRGVLVARRALPKLPAVSDLARLSSTKAAGSDYTLVYLGPKNSMVTAVKAFSLTTSAIGISAQVFVLTAGKGGATDFVLISGLGLFAVATPLLLHLLTSSYVFRLYASRDGAAYRAVTKNLLLCDRSVHFRPDQVTLTETGIPFANLSVSGGRKLFVDPAYSLDFESVARLFKAPPATGGGTSTTHSSK